MLHKGYERYKGDSQLSTVRGMHGARFFFGELQLFHSGLSRVSRGIQREYPLFVV